MRWVVGSGNHGCWLGSYELPKQRYIASVLRPNHVFYDIGANVGLYTLLAARNVGLGGKVYAFEPVPRNIDFLTRHVSLNGLKQVSIFPNAISDETRILRFASSSSGYAGHIHENGDLNVESTSLDHLVFDAGITPPNVLKLDIEGAEASALLGARTILQRFRPIVFVATHGKEAHSACCEYLRGQGYTIAGLAGEPATSVDELVCFPAKEA